MSEQAFEHGSTMHPDYTDLKAIKPYWGWMLLISLLLVIGGITAISYATTTSLITVMVLGVMLIVSGGFHLFAAAFSRGSKDFFISILIATLSLIMGFWVIYEPVGAAIALTLLFAIFFVLSGVIRMISAVIYRKELSWWGLVLFSGFISLILGVIIYAHWPVSGLWVIGLFVGIDIFFAGWRLMLLAFAAKNAQ